MCYLTLITPFGRMQLITMLCVDCTSALSLLYSDKATDIHSVEYATKSVASDSIERSHCNRV